MSTSDLVDQNRILRGLVQTNPDWKCPHGMDVPTMGHCPAGFPGCACADDRIAVLCEDENRVVSGLRNRERALVASLSHAVELFKSVVDRSEHEPDREWLDHAQDLLRGANHATEATNHATGESKEST